MLRIAGPVLVSGYSEMWAAKEWDRMTNVRLPKSRVAWQLPAARADRIQTASRVVGMASPQAMPTSASFGHWAPYREFMPVNL